MDTTQIDEAILSVVEGRWKKVAMVISRVEEALRIPETESESAFYVIAERIEAMVHNGHLVAQGDLKKWRFSEVRKPQ